MKEVEKVRIVLLTGHYRIMGDITLAKGTRLTDHIAGSKQFFAVTDAEVTNNEGRQILSAEFIDVHRDHVEIVMPDQPANLMKKSELGMSG